MKTEEIKQAIRAIGLALSAVNNCVATDEVGAEPTETSWRVDHSSELAKLDELERMLLGRENN